MKNQKLYFARFFLLFLIAVLLFSCASYRKAKAAKVLSQMEIEFSSISMDSVKVNPDLFEKIRSTLSTALPNPQVILLVQNLSRGIINEDLGDIFLKLNFKLNNPTEDSIWVRSVQGKVLLDSLLTLPISDSSVIPLLPGVQTISIRTSLKANQYLFSLPKIRKIEIQGALAVSLSSNGEVAIFNINETKTITETEMNELLNSARSSLLNGLIDDWAGSFIHIK